MSTQPARCAGGVLSAESESTGHGVQSWSWSTEQQKKESSVQVRAWELVSRDGSQPSHSASARSFATLGLYSSMVLTHGISPAFRDGVHIKSHTTNRQSVILEFTRSGNCVPMAFTAKKPCILSKTSNINKRTIVFLHLGERAKYILQLMFCVCCTRVGATALEANLIN